jgi:hypothetical protein
MDAAASARAVEFSPEKISHAKTIAFDPISR